MIRACDLHNVPDHVRQGTTIIKSRLYDLAALVHDAGTVDELVRRGEERKEREIKAVEDFFAGLGWK